MTESDSFHHIIQICFALKRRAPQVTTVLGGVCASVNHMQTLRAFDCVDFVLRGEGELAFQQLINALNNDSSLKGVGNLTYRSTDGVHANSELPLIANLDELPFPDLAHIDLWPEDALWVEIGRGCPFKCNFCVTAPYWHRKHRIKSPDRIIAELRYFKQKGRTDFNFTHDLFTTDRRWVLRFCRAMEDADLGVTWTCSSRTDTIDEEQICSMRRAGCRDIYFGLETGSEAMQAAIDKDLDLEAATNVIDCVLKSGMGATLGFIAGLPGENKTSLRNTLSQASRYLREPNTTVHLFAYCPYRGSSQFDEVFPKLEFDPYYIDFPLPATIRQKNCELMRAHFDVFSRYSRLNGYEDISL